MTFRLAMIALLGIAVAGCAQDAAKKALETKSAKISFEQDESGKLPALFESALTGEGAIGNWIVQSDPSTSNGTKVLAQTSADDTDYRFPLCIYQQTNARDVAVSVQFKAMTGKVDQAAGIAVRLKDTDNYYVVRANALENNVRLYKVVAGKRIQFAGVAHNVAVGVWHTLALEAAGTHFVVWLDGEKLFEADDRTFKTPGRVALWTKADSVTEFDDLQIKPK